MDASTLRAAARDLDDKVLARLIADLQAELEARRSPIPVASKAPTLARCGGSSASLW
jgi:hypothetical protein